MSAPSVSILLPVLDEIRTIDPCLDTLLDQDYDGPMEIVVADGGSRDGTRGRLEARAAADPRVRWIENTERVQSHGVNRAAAVAGGEILVRADAHTLYASDYVRRSVAGVAPWTAAGGPMRPEGTTTFGRAVAAAMRSPLGVGPAAFHHADEVVEGDTVYLGAYRREDFLALGGYRALPSGVAEDADFYFRWRRRGGRILIDPAIRSVYRPRETLGALARQSWRYGRGKAEMLYLNGRFPSWRPLAPLALVAGILAAGSAGIVTRRWGPLTALLASWGLVLGGAAMTSSAERRLRPGVAVAAGAMQLAYGAGLVRGLLAGRPRMDIGEDAGCDRAAPTVIG